MKKLFCFLREDEFLKSDDYSIISCDDNTDLCTFLNQLQKIYFSQMKVVQINFEAEHRCFSGQKALYPAAKATVFVLNRYSVVREEELLAELTAVEDTDVVFQTLELKSAFIEKVDIIKKEIAAGRLYQANLTAPLKAECLAPAEAIFKKYFSLLNGQYRALLPLSDDCSVISFSPELFLQKSGLMLTTRPIKGSLNSDKNFEAGLMADSKEEAELSMIVDLLRNDLNRIEPDPAGPHSAVVTKHRAALKLKYIQHTFSEIQIQTEKSLPEILECTLPGGSISGCPKLESLKLISELEAYKRQVYTGTIGWWKDNEFSLNLAIRTFIQYQDALYYHAGCGIVYDSDAEKEWAEFVLKTGKINAVL